MTPDLIFGAFAGAVATLVLLAIVGGVDWLLDRATTPRNTPDEHRDLTRHVELYDMEAPS